MKNKLVTALISAVIALAIWTYVVTVVSPNSDKTINNVPVVTQGEALLLERGLMITEKAVSTVSLQLEGSRVDLNKLSSSNITVTIDVSKIYEAGTHNLSFNVDVPSTGITVLSKTPNAMQVVVQERISKPVPVQVRYNGTVADAYVADKENVELDTKEITVTGPKSTVDQITAAMIDLDMEGRSESFSDRFTYTLCDAAGAPVNAQMVVTDFEDVGLTLRIMRVKELALIVNVVDGGGATEQTCVVTMDPPTIGVSGSDAMLEGMEILELGTIYLGEIPADTTLTLPIKLPEGIVNESGVTEANVHVSFPDLATKTLKVKNIVAVNVPENARVNVITKAVEILVRGPVDKIEALTEESFTVNVDFTDVEAGTVKLKADVDCGDPDIGAVGSYTVSASVRLSR